MSSRHTVEIRIETSGDTAEIGRARSDMQQLGATAQQAGGQVDAGMSRASQGTGRLNAALGSAKTAAIGFGAGLVGALATEHIVNFMSDSVAATSNLNEAMTASQAVFQSHGAEIQAWAQGAADSFGQSERQALEAATNFGLLFETMGLGEEAAAGMSMRVVELASDMASFKNIGVDEALQKIQAGLVGEIEPLRTVGVLLDAATVKTRAMEMGLADANGELSQAALVQARYSLILEQTTTMHGNYAATADDLANSQRTLEANTENLQAKIGKGLTPAMIEVTGAANDLISSPLFSGGLQAGGEQIGELTTTLQDIRAAADAASGPMNDLASAVGGLGAVSSATGDLFSGAFNILVPGGPLIQGIRDGRDALDQFGITSSEAGEKWSEFNSAILQNGMEAAGISVDGLTQSILDLIAAMGLRLPVEEETVEVTDRATAIERNRADMLENMTVATLEQAEADMRHREVMDGLVEDYGRLQQEGSRYNQMLTDSAGSYDAAAVAAGHMSNAMDDLQAVNDIMNQRIDDSANAISHWEDRVSGVDEALGYLDEQLEAGNITAEEHAEKVGKLTEYNDRLKQGIEDDLVPAFIDEQLAAADLQTALDDLDAKVQAGELSQEEAAAQARDLKAAFEEQTNPVGTLIEKIGELIQTLIDLENEDPTVTITANADAVQQAIEAMRQYAANNPINVPIHGVVAGGNDMVTYGGGSTAGLGDQSAIRDKSSLRDQFERAGLDAGLGFKEGFDAGVTESTPTITDIGADFGRDAGTSFGAEFGKHASEHFMAAARSIQSDFLSEGGLVALMTGANQAEYEKDKAAFEAYLGALMDAGFGPGSPIYDDAYEDYQAFLAEMELANDIAGTDSAQAFWEAWLLNQPLEDIEVAIWDVGELPEWAFAGRFAGDEFGSEFVEAAIDEADDIPDGVAHLPWGSAGEEAGIDFANAFKQVAEPIIDDIAQDALDAFNDYLTGDTGTPAGEETPADGDTDTPSGGGGPSSPGGGGGGGGGGQTGSIGGPGGIDNELGLEQFNFTGWAKDIIYQAMFEAGRQGDDWATYAGLAFQAGKKTVPELVDSLLKYDNPNVWMGGKNGPFLGFADGGYITGTGMAMLHPNEYITPDRSIPQLAQEIVRALGQQRGGGSVTIPIMLDGREISRYVINDLDRQLATG